MSERKKEKVYTFKAKQREKIHWNPDLAAGFMQIKYG